MLSMWIGFLFAAYAAVANDSIQTLGTFIASNQDKKWWVLWIFIGGIFLFTVGYSWVNYAGDVSHGRLMAKGFDVAPTEFHFLQIAAPVFLLILTICPVPAVSWVKVIPFPPAAASIPSKAAVLPIAVFIAVAR